MSLAPWLALGAIGLVLWLAFVAVPYVPEELNIDFAWMLSFAHFHEEGFQAGVEYVFTYGPLGFLNSSVYHPGLLAAKLLWEFSFKLVVVALALRKLRRLEDPTARGLCALGLLLLLVNQSYPDSGYLAGTFLVGAFLVERAGGSLWVALGLPLLAVLGLIKFTLFAFGTAIALLVALASAGRRGVGRGAGTLLYFLAGFAGAWVLSGQSLENVPVYLERSFSIASGYEEAAAREGRTLELALGIPLLMLNVAWLGCALRAAGGCREGLLLCGLAALALGLSWRHGFVGSGGFHFFAFAGLLPFFLPLPRSTSGTTRRARTGVLAAGVVLATAGLAVANAEERTPMRVLAAWAVQATRTLSLLSDPREWRASRERELAELRERYDLPRVRARVGRETVDVFHYQQGLVLLNGLHWKPRPLQSHMTFAPELSRLNAVFFESDAAPRFVLYRHEALHQRAPLGDDAAALRVVFQRYQPVLTEGSFLLLERRTDASSYAPPEPVFEGSLELGQWFDTSRWSDPLFVRLDVRYTLRGWLRRVLLRAPPLFLEVRTPSGRAAPVQLVRSIASQGFVLSPWLPTQGDLAAWRSGHASQPVTFFRVTAPGSGLAQSDVGVTILRDPSLTPRLTPEFVQFPMLEPQPDGVSSVERLEFAMVDGRLGLIVPPPGRLRYRLGAGSYLLEGWFGLVREGGAAQQVSFRVQRAPASGPTSTLFERRLEPKRSPDDRGPQRLKLTLELDERDELVLSTDAEPGARVTPYWSEVRVRPAKPEARGRRLSRPRRAGASSPRSSAHPPRAGPSDRDRRRAWPS